MQGRLTGRGSAIHGATGCRAARAWRSWRRCSVKRWTDGLFLATLFCVTFEKLQWNLAGTVSLADVLTIFFLLAFAASAGPRVPRTAVVVLVFFAAFLLVYLIGFYNLDTKQAADQFGKGMVKFVLHFLFLAAAVVYIVRGGLRTYWRALGFYVGGMAANSLYGVVQLLDARAGGNLDSTV